jgi:hypothetical protein
VRPVKPAVAWNDMLSVAAGSMLNPLNLAHICPVRRFMWARTSMDQGLIFICDSSRLQWRIRDAASTVL